MDDRNNSAIYILTNFNNTVLYIGVTHNLIRRVTEHKEKKISGFSQRYNLTKFVYFEHHNDIRDAIAREKQLKGGSRQKKISLIETMNPLWNDLFSSLL